MPGESKQVAQQCGCLLDRVLKITDEGGLLPVFGPTTVLGQ